MTDLEKIEADIQATKEKLLQLEQQASELRKAQKQAALEEIWRKMNEAGLSTADLKPIQKSKPRKPRVFRKYYLLEGVKYQVKSGRLPSEIAAYKASGGNLADITFSEDND